MEDPSSVAMARRLQQDITPTVIIASCTAARWIAAVSIYFVGTIFFTYGVCLSTGHCGTGPWNSISHSWEDPPGSSVSRFVVGTSSDAIAAVHVLLYVANAAAGRTPSHCAWFTNEVRGPRKL
jgi:hypothetical protein